MTGRLLGAAQRAIALWFILQIVLPFTAPLQICNLVDLIGHTEESPARPKPAAPQLASIRDAEANSFVSPLSDDALRICSCFWNLQVDECPDTWKTGPPSSPRTQHTILRL
jgi:hypothetical protein